MKRPNKLAGQKDVHASLMFVSEVRIYLIYSLLTGAPKRHFTRLRSALPANIRLGRRGLPGPPLAYLPNLQVMKKRQFYKTVYVCNLHMFAIS